MNTKQIPTGVEARLCDMIAERQALGIAKYGTTVADNPLSLRQWLQHQLEELLDAAVYTQRAIDELDASDNSRRFTIERITPAPPFVPPKPAPAVGQRVEITTNEGSCLSIGDRGVLVAYASHGGQCPWRYRRDGDPRVICLGVEHFRVIDETPKSLVEQSCVTMINVNGERYIATGDEARKILADIEKKREEDKARQMPWLRR